MRKGKRKKIFFFVTSVPEPDPDPKDLYVFGPPEFVSQRYLSGFGSRSGSSHHQAKIVKNPRFILFWRLLDLLSVKNDKMYLQK
jgi:hypothetical protein